MHAINKDTPADPAAKAAAAADEFFGREPGTAARLLGGDLSPDPEIAYEQAAEILDEWDSADSAAYQAREAAEAEAWGHRGPSASYEEWLAEGQLEPEAEL